MTLNDNVINFYEAVFSTAVDAIITKDFNGIVTSWNPAAEALFGYQASEIIGQSIFKIFPDGRTEEEDLILSRIARGEKISHIKTIRKHKDGHLLTVSLSISPIRAQDGKIIGASKIVRDLSDAEKYDVISRQLSAIVDSSEDAIISKTLDGIVQSWNNAAEKIFGYSASEIIGMPLLKLFPDDRKDEERHIIDKISRGESVDHFRTIRKRKNGTLVNVSVSISPIYDKAGNIIGASKIARDITHEIEKENIKTHFEAIVNSSDDAIVSKTLDGIVTSWNRGAEKIFGYTSEEMIGTSLLKIFPEDRVQEETKILSEVAQGRKVEHFQTVRKHKNGNIIHVSVTISPIIVDGKVIGVSKIARDITEHVDIQDRVWREANFDNLTLLPNRHHFLRLLSQQINKSKLNNDKFALIFVDLDNFKLINDNFGHDFGDKTLVVAANSIKKCIRASDTVARLGGDEFVILLPNTANCNDISKITQKILSEFQISNNIDNYKIALTASLGIAVYPEHGHSVTELMQKADAAMYSAKNHGRNQVQYFSIEASNSANESYQMMNDLRMAIAKDQLSLNFQPIWDNANAIVTKAEVLLRWNHPEKGMIPPDVFIPYAEKFGLIIEIGDWVFEQACMVLAEWVPQYGDDFKLSINKSPLQFHNIKESTNYVSEKLKQYNLSGENLIIEITENSLLDYTSIIEQILINYQQLGIEVAIDDFGTGYSSLAYLKKFNVDYLKIDKGFIHNLANDSSDFYLCEGISAIAHKLDLRIIAEGVETKQQIELLNEIGCDYFQGYYFSKPMTKADFESYMKKQFSN